MKKMAIRLDAGPSIGSGHLMRCLSLADALGENYGVEILFICRNKLTVPLEYKIVYLKNTYNLSLDSYEYTSIEDEISEMIDTLKREQVDALIVDHYGARDSYFDGLRDSVEFLFLIDDGIDRTASVDGVVNGNLYGIYANYHRIPLQLTGGQYTLLRKEFNEDIKRTVRKNMKEVFITSGGADPLRFCRKILELLLKWNDRIHYHVIVGNSFDSDYIRELEAYPAVLHFEANMKECMMQSDLFVTSAGSTIYELLVTHTPSISFCISKDQELLANTVWDLGLSAKGGYVHKLDSSYICVMMDMLQYCGKRYNMSQKSDKIISLSGAKNVASKIYKMLVCNGEKLRRADYKDCDLLFRWANDETNRKYAFSHEKINYMEHCEWYKKKLSNADCDIYIFEKDGCEAGQVRYDGEKCKKIDYFISPAFRGKGLSQRMLILGESVLRTEHDVVCFKAEVLYENTASQRVFEKLGYLREECESYVLFTKNLGDGL